MNVLVLCIYAFGLLKLEGILICGRTQSGTFKEGNLLVNRDGIRIVSQSEEEAVSL